MVKRNQVYGGINEKTLQLLPFLGNNNMALDTVSMPGSPGITVTVLMLNNEKHIVHKRNR